MAYLHCWQISLRRYYVPNTEIKFNFLNYEFIEEVKYAPKRFGGNH